MPAVNTRCGRGRCRYGLQGWCFGRCIPFLPTIWPCQISQIESIKSRLKFDLSRARFGLIWLDLIDLNLNSLIYVERWFRGGVTGRVSLAESSCGKTFLLYKITRWGGKKRRRETSRSKGLKDRWSGESSGVRGARAPPTNYHTVLHTVTGGHPRNS